MGDRGGYQGGPRDGPQCTIFCAQLTRECTERDLEKIFEENGFDVKSCQIPVDRYSGNHRGFGFVDLKNSDDVRDAVAQVNGKDLLGRDIKCEVKMPRAPNERKGRGRDGGGYGRRDSRDRGRGRRDSRGRGGRGGRDRDGDRGGRDRGGERRRERSRSRTPEKRRSEKRRSEKRRSETPKRKSSRAKDSGRDSSRARN